MSQQPPRAAPTPLAPPLPASPGNYPLVLIASLASDPSLTLFSGLKNPDLLGIQYIVLGSFIASLIQVRAPPRDDLTGKMTRDMTRHGTR